MKIALASDHPGYAEKERLKPLLTELGLEVEDLGTVSEESVDYPDYARKVAEQVAAGGRQDCRECTEDRGSLHRVLASHDVVTRRSA